MERAEQGAEPRQLLTFHVGENEYALPLLGVREIVPCETITPVPTTPAFLRGVVNLRGTALPVVDVAPKFGRGERALTRTSCLVVTDVGEAGAPPITMGLLVDAVGQVLELAPDALRAVPPIGHGVRLDYLAGMVEFETRFVLLLDLPRVLSAEELLVVATAEELRQALARAAEEAGGTEDAGGTEPAEETGAPEPPAPRRRRGGRKR
jgi:purine-binding chemotaxis protein CheW